MKQHFFVFLRKVKSAPIGAWKWNFKEIVADRPTDGQTRSSGSFTSNKLPDKVSNKFNSSNINNGTPPPPPPPTRPLNLPDHYQSLMLFNSTPWPTIPPPPLEPTPTLAPVTQKAGVVEKSKFSSVECWRLRGAPTRARTHARHAADAGC